MMCVMHGCSAESMDQLGAVKTDEMTCLGKGAATVPDGLWCVASWLRSYSGQYPHYQQFLLERPWQTR